MKIINNIKYLIGLKKTNNLECFDVLSNVKQFHMKVYGIKIYIYNNFLKKGLVIYGIVDDVIISFLRNKYILSVQKDILTNLPDSGFNEENMKQFASGNYPNPNAKAMFDDCVDNVQLWDLSKTEV